MSDETIQYITTDYLIEVDGGEPTPAPIEYIVELGQVGVQGVPGEKGEPGFSPTVGYILNDDTFRINITNQDGVIETPNLYDYFADKNGYLKVDGSNADSNIVINSIQLSNSMGTSIISTSSRLNLVSGTDSNIHLFPGGEGKVYYGGNPYANKEIATIGNIGNGTITLTQGGVTKGTFTTNQSGNTTIDLDAGGGSITNPLEIEDADSNNFISIGVNGSGANIRLGNTQGLAFNSYLIGNATAPLGLTNGAFGDKIIKLNIDSDTLEVNQDGELTVVGGGGATYTAGTGIDITSNIISIDTDVVAQLSDIPDVSNFVTNSSLSTTLQSYVLSSSLSTVATSGSYNDLLNKPTIPTNSDYVDLTSSQTITGKKAFSGAELETNNVITLKNNAIIRGLYGTNSYSTYLVGSGGSLLLGNESHGITLRGNTTRPVYRTGGTDYNIALSGDIPSLATTSTAGIVQPDGSTITVSNGVVKTEGVVNQQDSTTTLKYWTGTKAQYDAIATKDSNTLYNVTDDTLNLNNVANIDLSNITSTGKKVISNMAMPSGTYYDLYATNGIRLEGGVAYSYTAPCDGYFYMAAVLPYQGSFLGVWGDALYTRIEVRAAAANIWVCTPILPMKKGQTLTDIRASETPNEWVVRFLPAESEVS